MSRGIVAGNQAVARVAKRTGLPVEFDTNNPGDGRIYRMDVKGRTILRADSMKRFEALCEAFIEGFEACERENAKVDRVLAASPHDDIAVIANEG